MTTLTQSTTNKYWTYALWLAFFTIFYNLAEGLISIYFGAQDETLTLFGFSVQEYLIEVMSGIGILAMVLRIRANPNTPRFAIREDRPASYRHLLLHSLRRVGDHRHLQSLHRT